MTSKGQVTIPKPVREELNLKPGDVVDFVKEDGRITVRKHFDAAEFDAAIEEWSGYLDLGGKTVDEVISEMRDG
jgi:AbrB family looped-hinge helix DNA binding protein